jgi:hypothetical protein
MPPPPLSLPPNGREGVTLLLKGCNHSSQGCVERVRAWVRGESALLVAAGVGLGAMQLAALVAGVALCRGARAPHGSCRGAP